MLRPCSGLVLGPDQLWRADIQLPVGEELRAKVSLVLKT